MPGSEAGRAESAATETGRSSTTETETEIGCQAGLTGECVSLNCSVDTLRISLFLHKSLVGSWLRDRQEVAAATPVTRPAVCVKFDQQLQSSGSTINRHKESTCATPCWPVSRHFSRRSVCIPSRCLLQMVLMLPENVCITYPVLAVGCCRSGSPFDLVRETIQTHQIGCETS